MKYLAILVIALAAACGKEEAKTPDLTVPEAPAATNPSKTALDQAIEDTKALIAKKESDAKALAEKIKADPMKAATYQGEYDKLSKEISDLQAKLDGYMKEATSK
jgi:predicted  nucleic acid-binding Zn-ribbon protein